jgi:hypothetical protein
MSNDERLTVVVLDREQRARALDLEECVNEDPMLAACELIRLRDVLASITDLLSPITHPTTKEPIGFHMCFVRDADVPSLRQLSKSGQVHRTALQRSEQS